MVEEIVSCPHEEGIDYPKGEFVLNAHIGKAEIDSVARWCIKHMTRELRRESR